MVAEGLLEEAPSGKWLTASLAGCRGKPRGDCLVAQLPVEVRHLSIDERGDADASGFDIGQFDAELGEFSDAGVHRGVEPERLVGRSRLFLIAPSAISLCCFAELLVVANEVGEDAAQKREHLDRLIHVEGLCMGLGHNTPFVTRPTNNQYAIIVALPCNKNRFSVQPVRLWLNDIRPEIALCRSLHFW